jgi:Fe-S oxidoreductase
MPLSRRRATGWAEGLGVPSGGKTVLYTGLMYQLMPSMIALEKMLARFEDSSLRGILGVGRAANRKLNLSWFASFLVDREDQQTFDNILRDVVFLLRNADVEFGYLYEEELYAGALAHDEGICGAFEKQARRVLRLFQSHGVKRVITVDPHTTNILRTVYPKILPVNGLRVQSYLEILAESGKMPRRPPESAATIHDSCVYARHEGIVEEPRCLLEAAGVEVREPEHSGKMTFCCGGPIESLFPGKARAIAETRLQQLAAAGSNAITMCPICLVNLRGVARGQNVLVEDISGYLAAAERD